MTPVCVTHTPPYPPAVPYRHAGPGISIAHSHKGEPEPAALTARQSGVLKALADFGKASRRRRPKSPPEKNLGNMLTI